jgi:hypothetical protein
MRLLVAKLNRAAAIFDKTLYHSQSQAGAAYTTGAERAYAITQHVMRKTGAVVGYINA